MGEQADWKGVGDSLKSLGDKLGAHASEGADQVKGAASAAGDGVTDQTKAGAKAAVDKFDQATRDPEVGSALKDVTNKFLDAVKVTLTGGDAPKEPTEPEAPQAPKSVEPPSE